MINMYKKIVIIITFIFLIIIGRLIYLNIYMHDYYLDNLLSKTNYYVYGSSARRGRILDVNGNILVDNKTINTVFYNKLDGVTLEEEIEIANMLANILTIEHGSIIEQKDYYLKLNNNGEGLITEEEYELYEKRKLTSEDLLKLKYERINLDAFTDLEKECSKIYNLMNENYKFDKKEIISNVSDIEFAQIAESNIKGVLAEITYERVYNYGDTLKSIFGSIGSIHVEDVDKYLENNYSLNDIVGISYLEEEYEHYLKGEKAVYKVNENGSLKLVKEESPGSDIYLSIDINIQLELDEIVKEELLNAQSKRNTDYFTDTFAAISDPLTGKIIAITGQRIISNNKSYSYEEITNEILSSSYTTGSVIKAASMAVGYNNNLIDTNEYIYDSCVKLEFIPEKCSWEPLGKLNDITALKMSSNYYQYLLAINLAGESYIRNMQFDPSEEVFDIYRNTFKEFGLGTYTNIDLPGETIGNKGSVVAGDLLLNLAIGQYDTYTTLQLLQYINTIANNKNRLELSLLDKVVNDKEIIYIHSNDILNTLSLDNTSYERIKIGLSEVITSGTGYAYINKNYNPAGKTGTSESFLDIDNDMTIDVKTTSLTFVGYFPVDQPKYSIAIISPHIAYKEEDDDYIYRAPRYISTHITDFLFENYK